MTWGIRALTYNQSCYLGWHLGYCQRVGYQGYCLAWQQSCSTTGNSGEVLDEDHIPGGASFRHCVKEGHCVRKMFNEQGSSMSSTKVSYSRVSASVVTNQACYSESMHIFALRNITEIIFQAWHSAPEWNPRWLYVLFWPMYRSAEEIRGRSQVHIWSR